MNIDFAAHKQKEKQTAENEGRKAAEDKVKQAKAKAKLLAKEHVGHELIDQGIQQQQDEP